MANPKCISCGEEYDERRKALGYDTCLSCGSPSPTRTIVPLHKSGFVVVTDKEELKQLDPKHKSY